MHFFSLQTRVEFNKAKQMNEMRDKRMTRPEALLCARFTLNSRKFLTKTSILLQSYQIPHHLHYHKSFHFLVFRVFWKAFVLCLISTSSELVMGKWEPMTSNFILSVPSVPTFISEPFLVILPAYQNTYHNTRVV